MSADDLMARIDEARRRNQAVASDLLPELAAEIRDMYQAAQQALQNLNRDHRSRIPNPGAGVLSERGVFAVNGGNREAIQQAADRVMHPDNEYVPRSALNNPPQDFSHAEPQVLAQDLESRAFGVSRPFCSAGGCEQYIDEIVDSERRILTFATDEGRTSVRSGIRPGTAHLFYPGELIPDTNGSLSGGGGGGVYQMPLDLSSEELDRHSRAAAEQILERNGVASEIANTAGNTFSPGGALRGVSRALGPAGSLIGGASSLYDAYSADGGITGENFTETVGGMAGGAAGGWGGAAAGAALGTAIFPGVGTVVGGIAGGIIGGIGGETVGEYLGGLF